VLSKRGLSSNSNDLGDALDGLFREYDMPRTLKEVGVEGDKKFQEIAIHNLTEAWCQTNFISITSKDQVLEISNFVKG
jgi:alcohol dehydrogenase class IV